MGDRSPMDVTAILLSWKRVGNLDKIIRSLQGNSVEPKEIIVINNNPGIQLAKPGTTVINCWKNFGCLIRHAIGMMATTSHCLFVDDDLKLGPKVIENFAHWRKKFPEAILGYFGAILEKGDKPYSKKRNVHARKVKSATKVDIVKGRVHFCRTSKLHQSFRFVAESKLDIGHFSLKEDDILLSLANRHYGHENYVIPIGAGAGYTELAEGGVSLSIPCGPHFAARDRAVRWIRGHDHV